MLPLLLLFMMMLLLLLPILCPTNPTFSRDMSEGLVILRNWLWLSLELLGRVTECRRWYMLAPADGVPTAFLSSRVELDMLVLEKGIDNP